MYTTTQRALRVLNAVATDTAYGTATLTLFASPLCVCVCAPSVCVCVCLLHAPRCVRACTRASCNTRMYVSSTPIRVYTSLRRVSIVEKNFGSFREESSFGFFSDAMFFLFGEVLFGFCFLCFVSAFVLWVLF